MYPVFVTYQVCVCVCRFRRPSIPKATEGAVNAQGWARELLSRMILPYVAIAGPMRFNLSIILGSLQCRLGLGSFRFPVWIAKRWWEALKWRKQPFDPLRSPRDTNLSFDVPKVSHFRSYSNHFRPWFDTASLESNACLWYLILGSSWYSATCRREAACTCFDMVWLMPTSFVKTSLECSLASEEVCKSFVNFERPHGDPPQSTPVDSVPPSKATCASWGAGVLSLCRSIWWQKRSEWDTMCIHAQCGESMRI